MGIQQIRRRLLLGITALSLMGCEAMSPERPTLEGDLSVIDETGLNEVMLTLANPAQAVAHFRGRLAAEPTKPEFQRGLAKALVRNKQPDAAAPVFQQLINSGQATHGDRLEYAEALIGSGAVADAGEQLKTVPPEVNTYKRNLLEAIVADNNKDWTSADNYYKTARGLTNRPAPILNNWGMSKLARGKNLEAAGLFQQSITFDPKLFTAKNNLVTSRARARNYQLPVIPMSEIEEATLLHNMGIIAVRQGDTDVARGLFEEAIETHPQHYQEAVQNLAALSRTVGR